MYTRTKKFADLADLGLERISNLYMYCSNWRESIQPPGSLGRRGRCTDTCGQTRSLGIEVVCLSVTSIPG